MNLQNREGPRVPEAIFKTRRDHEWIDVSSSGIFDGRTVVVFATPGAFTPTCCATHPPRYSQLAGELQHHGVDETICISVNDAFVMKEWRTGQKASNVTFLPDGSCILAPSGCQRGPDRATGARKVWPGDSLQDGFHPDASRAVRTRGDHGNETDLCRCGRKGRGDSPDRRQRRRDTAGIRGGGPNRRYEGRFRQHDSDSSDQCGGRGNDEDSGVRPVYQSLHRLRNGMAGSGTAWETTKTGRPLAKR